MGNIPKEHKWRYFFHMTDFRNLESILQHGLLCTNLKNTHGIQHKNIANELIQERRADMEVPCGQKGKLHDYVPFYFTSLNPMLLGVLNKKNVDQPLIIFLCFKIDKLEELSAIFTDASANTNVLPNFYSDTKDLGNLDWRLIDSTRWSYENSDDRHKKMAEALVYQKVSIEHIDSIVVYNKGIKNKVEEILKENNVAGIEVVYPFELTEDHHYNFYYTKFFIPDMKNQTLVTGPILLANDFSSCLQEIENKRTNMQDFHYANIQDFLESVNTKFDCIPELAGIYGLESTNPMHPETVSSHTQQVVKQIKNTQLYNESEEYSQCLLVLSAYLHDIGKGPKSKWSDGKIGWYPDHPADAIPMVTRVLSEEIGMLSVEDIRKICIMVIFHDLVGDCMFKGRSLEQVVELIKEESELELLMTISEADIKAISDSWGYEFDERKEAFKQKVLEQWKQKK